MTVIKHRRGTAALWTSTNPILAEGELGLETDTGKFKFGNGTTAWVGLSYSAFTDISGKSDVGHTHTFDDITDATATGKAVGRATDAAAARTAIGAGTSNLAIGSTATTAKAGNWFPSFAEVTGTLGTNQLPPLAINEVFTAASQTAMTSLVAQRGDMAIRTDFTPAKVYVLATDAPTVVADWKEITASGAVLSVAGKTGAVVLAKADVGLTNVDNTSDVDKPVSSATQTALNGKANSSHTHSAVDILSVDGGAP